MKLFSLFQKVSEAKASRAYAAHVRQLPEAVWSPRNYGAFVKEGYKINVVAYQAINKIADSIGSMQWVAFDKNGKQLKDHPYLKLIKRPNPVQSGKEWWRAKVSYLLLSGNGYDERIMRGRTPVELWTLRPDRMSIKPGQTGIPRAYQYRAGGQTVTFPANDITGESDIRHTKLFSADDDWYGMSPMNAAAFAIDQHNEAMAWLQALLQNAATPSGALMVDKETALSEDQFKRLREEIEESFSGSRNAGRPMLLEGGMKWENMSLSPSDMLIVDIKDSAARDISLAFGVPPLLLNIPGDNTYSNYREARLGFFEDTVIPLADMMAAEMNEWLGPYFGGVQVLPDYDSIEAIAEKRRGLWEMVDTSDEITVNEARELKGYPPLPAPLGNMLMADLRSSRRGHTSPRSNAAQEGSSNMLEEFTYGNEPAD